MRLYNVTKGKRITEKINQTLAVEEFLAKYKDGYEPREIDYIRRNWLI